MISKPSGNAEIPGQDDRRLGGAGDEELDGHDATDPDGGTRLVQEVVVLVLEVLLRFRHIEEPHRP